MCWLRPWVGWRAPTPRTAPTPRDRTGAVRPGLITGGQPHHLLGHTTPRPPQPSGLLSPVSFLFAPTTSSASASSSAARRALSCVSPCLPVPTTAAATLALAAQRQPVAVMPVRRNPVRAQLAPRLVSPAPVHRTSLLLINLLHPLLDTLALRIAASLD